MREIVLTYPTEYGLEEIFIDTDKTTFGRGGDVEYHFTDNGLSRLHASIFREGDDVWIVDEFSSNGTFVNGEQVSSNGTPLQDGDLIKIGNNTKLKVSITEKKSSKPSPVDNTAQKNVAINNNASEKKPPILIPLAVTGFALLLVLASIGFIGYVVIAGGGKTTAQDTADEDISQNNSENLSSDEDKNVNTSKSETTDNTVTTTAYNASVTPTPTDNNSNITDFPTTDNRKTNINVPSGKKYLQMSSEERNSYIRLKAMKVARIIGNRSASSIPPLAVTRIRRFADAYAKRINAPKKNTCKFGDNLQATFERASKNAPFIIKAFNQHGIDPQIGLYLAMIESEHCVCLQSPTGPLGMFQFTTSTAKNYGLDARLSASPSNPDERCKPRPAAMAAAKYMKYLNGRYGTGPSSIPLAIGSYNSGEGGLSKNLRIALESNKDLPRDFWTMIANGEKLSRQFQSENFKYVPKFFAAAIIGENPRDFGLTLQPLSVYGG